jgi:D-serine deaminase-like pyridoxal phosphate-dependent protein
MHLADLPTPAAVVDLDIVERNCARMAERLAAQGVRIRPHVKTHKCTALAKLQGGQGITVSTVAEARAFGAAGFHDQILAVPVAPQRIEEVLELGREFRLAVLVDDPEVAAKLSRSAEGRGQRAPVWLKVDCGYHRAGVDPLSPRAMSLARSLAQAPGLDFQGLLTHAGHSYDCVDAAGILRVAQQEVSVLTGLARRLRASGVPVPGVSVGSTPTLSVPHDLGGVTEGRPGNYVFYDLHQAAIGSCTVADIAISVLSTVIGVYPDRGTLLLDAGALALSKDPGATHMADGPSWGLLMALSGRPLPGLRMVGLSQEHGKVRISQAGNVSSLAVGDRVRVLPNHSCLVAAMHAQLVVVRGQQVIDRWSPVRGW